MESKRTYKRDIKVNSPGGLHMRELTRLVLAATPFECSVKVVYEGRKVDAKSILSLAALPIKGVDHLQVEAEGEDAQDCLNALAQASEQNPRIPKTWDN